MAMVGRLWSRLSTIDNRPGRLSRDHRGEVSPSFSSTSQFRVSYPTSATAKSSSRASSSVPASKSLMASSTASASSVFAVTGFESSDAAEPVAVTGSGAAIEAGGASSHAC